MRSTKPATNKLAPFDTQALLDLRRDAHQSYARCGDDVAPRYAISIIDFELELQRRNVQIDSPCEADVPLRHLRNALRQSTAVKRIRRAAEDRDVETFWVSLPYLSLDDIPEAWHFVYGFRQDPAGVCRLLERLFITALAHREGFAAASAVCDDLVQSQETRTRFATMIETALRDLLKVPAPMNALISSLRRFREDQE